MTVAIGAGIAAGSTLLTAFGIDSLIPYLSVALNWIACFAWVFFAGLPTGGRNQSRSQADFEDWLSFPSFFIEIMPKGSSMPP